ncbi:hypothetical protein M3Y97_00809100 [Aphelenchoides bicaudatus]|nr:hypothetical protein M3Y97_00809100 [Aphelenchoides bicaudatus]
MTESAEESVFQPADYDNEFDGKAYLELFYSEEAMSHGNRISLFLLPNYVEVIRKTTPADKRITLLDVGSGPTIYSAICFRNIVSKIFLSDYLDSNLEIIRKWLDKKNNFDWTPVIKTIARNEGLPTTESTFNKIENETRDVLRDGGILHSNVHKKWILGTNPENEFDVLVSIFCLEAACSSMSEYKRALKNMMRLLRSGGYFILGSVLDDDQYVCGVFQDKPKIFSVLNLTEKCIFNALEEAGIDLSTMIRTDLRHQGVIFCMAKKI